MKILRFIVEKGESLDIFESQIQYHPLRNVFRDELIGDYENGKYIHLIKEIYENIWLKADGSAFCKIMMLTDEDTFIRYFSNEMFPVLLNILRRYIPGEYIPEFLWDNDCDDNCRLIN